MKLYRSPNIQNWPETRVTRIPRSARAAAAVCGSLLMGILTGCGGGKPAVEGREATYETTGTVRLEGAPLADATVIFHAMDHALSASGTTDDAGRFSLTTYDQDDGAVAGRHRVTIKKTSFTSTPDPRGDPFPPRTVETSILAPEYANPRTSGLTAEVAADQSNDLLFDLHASASE